MYVTWTIAQQFGLQTVFMLKCFDFYSVCNLNENFFSTFISKDDTYLTIRYNENELCSFINIIY